MAKKATTSHRQFKINGKLRLREPKGAVAGCGRKFPPFGKVGTITGIKGKVLVVDFGKPRFTGRGMFRLQVGGGVWNIPKTSDLIDRRYTA
jgi:hypothetical protein